MPPPRELADELAACLCFYTRLPMPVTNLPARGFAAAQWAAPVAGMVVALVGFAAWQLASLVGIPDAPAAAIAIASTMLATGCLHEDGLSDTADGFGGGRTRERVLEIMRDSRIGTYGAAALGVSILLRWASLAELHSADQVLAALIAAHAASRALIPACLALLPPARADGLSAGAGRPGRETAIAAGLIGAAALLLLRPGAAIAAAIVLVLVFWSFKRICVDKIGGQTGDTLGALQQTGEIAVLLIAASAL